MARVFLPTVSRAVAHTMVSRQPVLPSTLWPPAGSSSADFAIEPESVSCMIRRRFLEAQVFIPLSTALTPVCLEKCSRALWRNHERLLEEVHEGRSGSVHGVSADPKRGGTGTRDL